MSGIRKSSCLEAVNKDVEASIPEKYRSGWVKARFGEVSPRAAIRMKCRECVGFEDMRLRIGECNCSYCPIWAFRPYQSFK